MRLAEIETERLRLRPWRRADLDDLHRLWIDPGVRKYLWDDEVISLEQAASMIESSLESFARHGFGQWAVFAKGAETLIGFCGFRFFGEPPEVELLYGIAPAYWGQGLAAEAARAMLRCGFEEHGFERIYAGADPPNAASFRVMEKVGMICDQRKGVNNLDAIYYLISRDAFQPDDSFYRVRRA